MGAKAILAAITVYSLFICQALWAASQIAVPQGQNYPKEQLKNIDRFCAWNAMGDFLQGSYLGWEGKVINDRDVQYYFSNPSKLPVQGSDPRLRSDSVDWENFTIEAWKAQKIPLEEPRKAAFRNALDALNYLKTGSTEPLSQGMYTIEEFEAKEYDVQASDLNNSSALLYAACGTLVPLLDVPTCKSNLDKLVTLMMPKGGLTFTEGLFEILRDKSYWPGLKDAAILIAEKAGGGQVSSTLYDDLLNSFKKYSSIEKAEHMTWTTLAVIASGGANIGMKIFTFFKTPREYDSAKVSLALIGSSTPFIDFRSRARGHIYSYPSEIKTTCDHGKPYHFWMSAYLSYRLSRDNGNIRAAAGAAYAAEIGYQMLSNTAGRDTRATFTRQPYSYTNNVMRIDLSFSAAAAWFGARAARRMKSQLNVDSGIGLTMRTAFGFTPLDTDSSAKLLNEKIKAATRWTLLFSPHPSYHYFDSVLVWQDMKARSRFWDRN